MDETRASICKVCGRPILDDDAADCVRICCRCSPWRMDRSDPESYGRGKLLTMDERRHLGDDPGAWDGAIMYMDLSSESHDDMENYFNNHTARRLHMEPAEVLDYGKEDMNICENGLPNDNMPDNAESGDLGIEEDLPPAPPPHYGPGAFNDGLEDFIETDMPSQLYGSSPSSSDVSGDAQSDDLEPIFAAAASGGESDVNDGVERLDCGDNTEHPRPPPHITQQHMPAYCSQCADGTNPDYNFIPKCRHNRCGNRHALNRSHSADELWTADFGATNNLNTTSSTADGCRASVSRQTSTANCEQDENSYQDAGGLTASQSDDQLGGRSGRTHAVQAVYGDPVYNNGSTLNRPLGCDGDMRLMRTTNEDGVEDDRMRMPALEALIFSNFIRDYCRTQEPVDRMVTPVHHHHHHPSHHHHQPPPAPPPPHLSDAERSTSAMIWSESEARTYHVSQIGTSACGATSAINVLKAFEIHVEASELLSAVMINKRSNHAALPQYLLSRSVAGCTASQLISGIERLTDGYICGTFFHFYPQRGVQLSDWLAQWIEIGAVPVVTLNLQKSVPEHWTVPDAWHHQMVYGVGPRGIFLTNPLEIVSEHQIRSQLCSQSELLIRREDVISHWHDDCDLSILLQQADARWRHMNVLGQVVHVLREEGQTWIPGFRPQLTTHIMIPAWYQSGVSLFVRRHSAAHKRLVETSNELPLCHAVSHDGSVT